MSLPQELIDEIFNYLPLNKPQTFRNCSLVAKSWVHPSQKGCFIPSVSLNQHTACGWIASLPKITNCCTMSAPSHTPSTQPRGSVFRLTVSIPLPIIYPRFITSEASSCLRWIFNRTSPNRLRTSQPSGSLYHLYPSGVVMYHPVYSLPSSTISPTLLTSSSALQSTPRITNQSLPFRDPYAAGSVS